MFFSLRSIVIVVLSVACTPLVVQAADKAKPEKAKPENAKPEKARETKGAAKGTAATNKLVSVLQRTFKLWDSNKDDVVDQEELEKFYAKLKPKQVKGKKKEDLAGIGAADPLAAVTAMQAKVDKDSDGKMTRAEFDEWAVSFADYLAKGIDLNNQRLGTEREIAKIQGLLAKSGGVTAADGIFEQEMRRGLIGYRQTLEQIDRQLKDLDATGHGAYRDLLLPQLNR